MAVDGADASGFTALSTAACHGRDAVAALLLRYRAEVGRADRRGMTALHWAASQQRAAACALLVGAGAPLEARGGAAALTPLLLAAKNQVPNYVMIHP